VADGNVIVNTAQPGSERKSGRPRSFGVCRQSKQVLAQSENLSMLKARGPWRDRMAWIFEMWVSILLFHN